MPTCSETLVELLGMQTKQFPGKVAFRWFVDGEDSERTLTYAEFDRDARIIAQALIERDAVNQRIALVYDSSFDFIPAFLGCLMAGAVAVPLPAPRSRNTLPRVMSILADAEPLLILSESATSERAQSITGGKRPEIAWIETDRLPDSTQPAKDGELPFISQETLACLQYTSGSTRTPVGVMIRHGNFLANLQAIQECFGTDDQVQNVCWLPHYHDMGLVGGLLGGIGCGATTTLLTPAAFLQRPLRWLQAISRYGGTHSGGPNFAYDLCTEQIHETELSQLDLSSWRVAFNGAEPVQARTLRSFAERFAPCGFQADAFLPCYGLAEATLLVAGKPHHLSPVITADWPSSRNSRRRRGEAVSSGTVVFAHEVRLIDPDNGESSGLGDEGEILVAGPSVAAGYWGREDETGATFVSQLDATGQERRFLKTGDLGRMIDGELFVTGRQKDLLIFRGQNHYPQDVEAVVAASHSALADHWGAAISLHVEGEERLVIVHELTRSERKHPPEPIVTAIRSEVGAKCDLGVWSIALLNPGKLPRTSSGKVQRQQTRQAYLNGVLEPLHLWVSAARGDTSEINPSRGVSTASESDPATSYSSGEIRDWLILEIAGRLGESPDKIDPETEFVHLGLGSMALVEVAGKLQRRLDRDLSPTLLYEFPTPSSLSEHLANEVSPTAVPSRDKGEPTASAKQAPPATPEDESGVAIAIVGIGCRFPGASSPTDFWRLLSSGVDAIRDRPDRDGFGEAVDPATRKDRTRGGYLDQVDLFDAEFFQIAPREADCLDPQQRLMLEVTWEGLEDAGIAPSSLRQTEVGVFIGISNSDFRGISERSDNARDLHSCTGSALGMAANRLSYFFDWTGPSQAIDTACSSSLVAVHAACNSLANGECRLALAGGVNLILAENVTAAFERARFLAPDGRCKAFDAQADGYVRGEGAGVVVLKPLQAALSEGDRVYAVIEGTAVSQDGRSNGLTAPNPRSQQAVIRAACRRAGVLPSSLQYVEAHGTGTSLGDPIEAKALGQLINEVTTNEPSCFIGSVKTNIGHLEPAAGIAGLIKTALMLHHETVVPSLHFDRPNPLIPFDELPIRVATQTADWPATTNRRLAGVSAFGFGGTNAHAILTSVPSASDGPLDQPAVPPDTCLLPVSAASKSSLLALLDAYITLLPRQVETVAQWREVCLAAATNREHHRWRVGVIADSPQTAVTELQAARDRVIAAADAIASPGDASESDGPLAELRHRYESGEQIDWRGHYGGRGPVISLPLYPWNRRRFWPKPIQDTVDAVGATPVDSTSRCPSTTPFDSPVIEETTTMIMPTSETFPQPDTASITEFVRSRAASALGNDTEGVDVERPLLELGMDSLMAVELVNDVQEEFGVRVPFDQLLVGTRLVDVAALIADQLSQPGTADSATPASSSTRLADSIPADSVHIAVADEHSPRKELSPPEPTPLSPSQERLWLLSQLAGTQVLNIPVGVRLEGDLDVQALEQSLAELAARHEILRMTFRMEGDTVLQVPQSAQRVPLHVVHLSPMSIEERRREANRMMAELSARPFDLEHGPVLRALLLRVAPDEHWLGLVVTHLVADGASLAVLIRELATLYQDRINGQKARLTPLRLTFREVARHQREHLGSEQSRQLSDHWRQQLDSIPTTLALPTDMARPAIMTHIGRRRYFSLSRSTSDRIKAFSQKHSVTPFMTLLAAFQTLLGRSSSQEQFLVGVPAAGRSHPDLQNLVGVLMTPLPLPANLAGDPTFVELLTRVRNSALDAYRHSSVSLEELVEEMDVILDPGRPPLFQTLFDLQDRIPLPDRLGEVDLTLLELDPGVSILDLSLYMAAEAEGYRGFFEYNTDLFLPETIDRFIDRFQALLAGILDDPDRPLSQLPLLGADEQSLLASWNRTETEYPDQDCIHELFEEQVRRTPDATALIFRGSGMSYRELNSRADELAAWLIAQKVQPEEFVGVCLERSLEMVIGLLGILKAGAAYVPLDPTYPQSRQQWILEDSKARIVLTQRRLRRQFPDHVNACCLDSNWGEVADVSTDGKRVAVSPDQLAYMIHTSGSTGRPKGVMVTHRNVANFFQAITNLDPDQPPGTLLAVTTISFDISVLELLWTLTRGFRVVLVPAQGQVKSQLPPIRSTRAPVQFSLFYFDCEETGQAGGKYDLVLEGARFADQHEFTAVWTPERHFHPFGGVFPNPSVVMSAVAAQTRHVGIRAGSVVLPLHHPIRVAEDWAVVDNISGGRVGLAFAPGSHPNDFVLAPEIYTDRKEAMQREIETVRALWRGESVRRINGNGEEVEITIHPRPVQPELPVWMTAIGMGSFQHAGQQGYNVLTHLLFHDTRDLTEKIVAYRQARRAAGFEDDGHVSLMVHTYVGTSLSQVREAVYEPLTGYLRSSADLFIKMGLASRFKVDVSQMAEDDVEAFVERAFDRFFDFNGLLGTPETCATMVETLRAIGVDEVACLIDFGVGMEEAMQGLVHLNDVRQRVNRPLLADLESTEEQTSLTDLILRYDVTHLQCTPAMARMLLTEANAEEAFAQLETLYVGGDSLPLDLATELQRHVSGRVHNMYGPTETTVWSTSYTLPNRISTVRIGTPVANTRVYILDSAQRIVPLGTVGELYIGGHGVSRGYWQQDELTAERFLPDQFSSEPGSRLYRTGDQARWRSDGTLEFLGRLDHQVKIRGHRIELGEIESALTLHEQINQCVVLAKTDLTGEKQLVAFVQPNNVAVDVSALRQHLGNRLPDYMIPSSWIGVDEFPLTDNRKIDRRQLLESRGVELSSQSSMEPASSLSRERAVNFNRQASAQNAKDVVKWRTSTERSLIQMWRGVLERDHPISVHDNFFELGGHSLQATLLVTRIRQAFNIDLSLRDFFEAETLADLAALIDARPASPREAAVTAER